MVDSRFAVIPVKFIPYNRPKFKVKYVVVKIGRQEIVFGAREVVQFLVGQTNYLHVQFDSGARFTFTHDEVLRMLLSGVFDVSIIDNNTICIEVPNFARDANVGRAGTSESTTDVRDNDTTNAYEDEAAGGDQNPSTPRAKKNPESVDSSAEEKDSNKPSKAAIDRVKKQLNF